MCIRLICFCFTAFSTIGSASAADTITFYRDGALLQQKAAAVKGVIDLPLAPGVLEHTVTIVPAPGTTILGVETVTTKSDSKTDKELDALVEQRRRLEDRLQALETREAIFTSSAKAQSGKAPRKTKTNPDPMLAIRQGTDFAIAQLEAVYTARRKTTDEIQRINSRITTTRKNSRGAESFIRVAVTPSRGMVTLRYATSERGWLPQYQLFVTGDGSAHLKLSARIKGSGHGHQQMRVSSGSLAESSTSETIPVQSGSAVLASYLLPISEEHYTEEIFNRFSGTIMNNTPHYLPPGESVLLRKGAYLGKFIFEGISSGRSRIISLGM
jgi:hypothetical protein